MKLLFVILALLVITSCSDVEITPKTPIVDNPKPTLNPYPLNGFWFVEEVKTDSRALVTYAYPCTNTSSGVGVGGFNYDLDEAKLYAITFKNDSIIVSKLKTVYLCDEKSITRNKFELTKGKLSSNSKSWRLSQVFGDTTHIYLKTKIQSLDDSIQYKLKKIHQ